MGCLGAAKFGTRGESSGRVGCSPLRHACKTSGPRTCAKLCARSGMYVHTREEGIAADRSTCKSKADGNGRMLDVNTWHHHRDVVTCCVLRADGYRWWQRCGNRCDCTTMLTWNRSCNSPSTYFCHVSSCYPSLVSLPPLPRSLFVIWCTVLSLSLPLSESMLVCRLTARCCMPLLSYRRVLFQKLQHVLSLQV